MAGRARELIVPSVRKLITSLSGFKEEEENFQLCEQFALSNIWHHRFLSVDSHAVRRSIEGIITKLEVHGHFDAAKKLSELLKTYLSYDVFKDHPQFDIHWALLSLLMHLSVNPTANVSYLKSIKYVPEKAEVQDDFDWVSYLREGDENFSLGVYDSEDSDTGWDSSVQDISDSESVKSDSAEASDQSVRDDICLEAVVKVKQKEEFIRALEEIRASEKWLEMNLQHPYWISQENKESIFCSKHPSANFAERWFKYLEQQDISTSDFRILSEYQIIREILRMFHAPNSSFLFVEEDGKFVPKRNITVSSLSPESVYEYLNHFCPYFDMLKEMMKFGNEITSAKNCETSVLPPHTYEAYWAALKELIHDMCSFLISIEEIVIKQECTYTFVSLDNDLKEKLLELKIIFNVHKRAICEWKQVQNWEAASRLLSVLYGELVQSCTCKQATINLHLFFKSFRVFVDIIDVWMTEGLLEDCRNEFVISRSNDQMIEKQNDLWMEGYAVHPHEAVLVSAGIAPMQLMKILMTSVLHAGKSVDLLLGLDRLSDLRKKTRTGGKLYWKLLSSIENDISKFIFQEVGHPELQKKEDPWVVSKEQEQNNNILPDIKDHLCYFADPLLIKVFENYLNLTDGGSVNGTSNIIQEFNEETKERNAVFKRLKGHLKCPILPLKSILENNLRRLVQDKQMISCNMVKSIFQYEFKLLMHIKVIRSVFLMEAGDIMHQFCTTLFKQMEIGWVNSFSLSWSLESCIDVRYPEYGNRFSFVIDEYVGPSSVLEQINMIQLQYKVDWPLSLVLSNYNMKLYNSVFQFLLKIKWALWNLQQLRFSDLEQHYTAKSTVREQEKKIMHRLHFLRFWLLHSVSSIHSYLMGQVINLLGPELEQSIEKAPDLDTIIDVHNTYVHTVHTCCLQPGSTERIKTAILQMVTITSSMCLIWRKGPTLVSEARLKEVEELYFKWHCFLGIVLTSTVESGTAPQFGELCAAFDASSLSFAT